MGLRKDFREVGSDFKNHPLQMTLLTLGLVAGTLTGLAVEHIWGPERSHLLIEQPYDVDSDTEQFIHRK